MPRLATFKTAFLWASLLKSHTNSHDRLKCCTHRKVDCLRHLMGKGIHITAEASHFIKVFVPNFTMQDSFTGRISILISQLFNCLIVCIFMT